MTADDIFQELTQLRERVARLNERHDDLPWDSFNERFTLKAEVADLEARMTELRRVAAIDHD